MKPWFVVGFGGVLMAVVLAGCGKSLTTGLGGRPPEVDLPTWFTAPTADMHADIPVSLGVSLPEHLQPLARQYSLPNWVVYGVVRALGSQEFVANGVYRSYSVVDESGESRVVIDDLFYDVPMDQARQLLAGIAEECGKAETERGRMDVLGSFVKQRFGSMLLFSLDRQADMRTNLLLVSGKSCDPTERFSDGQPASMPPIGWKEEDGYTKTTMVGTFHYGNAELSFRRVEEEAIRDLAKGLMYKFSHMRKSFVVGGVDVSDDMKEETYKEEITLRMRGVVVRRRVVDMKRGLCLVEVCVPVGGVARQ
ncbi:MAG TPA: hypothetical protein DCS43_12865 [Verrucomicrobia bacterium]|nr:hypothetical protein [Verrucomicrobiota bacterium]